MKLLFVGDVMLGRLINEILKKENFAYPWGDTLSIFRNADVRICNLECVISDQKIPQKNSTPKIFRFRSSAKNVESLKIAGIDIVSLANNHSLDYGEKALLNMLEILKKAKISYSGAGKNFKEVSQPVMLEKQRIKIGFISFSDNEPAWEATAKKLGIFYSPIDLKDKRAQKLFEIIQETKKKVDFLAVSCHWGPNWGYWPQPSHIPFAHTLIEAGADIVFGHSCHVFQGIEFYKGKPILYSAGDFIDDYAIDEIERNDQSFIFFIEDGEHGVLNIRLYPTIISKFQVNLAKGIVALEIANKIKNLCAEFKTRAEWNGEYLEIFPSA